MNKVAAIEYYLGKTHHKNLYFNGTIPPAWVFPSYQLDLEKAKNQKISPLNENLVYTINNLGYHSEFDYDNSLKVTNNILCLGDSNTFGLITPGNNTWVKHLSKTFPDHKILNLGLPGAGSDTVARIGVNTVQCLPVTAVLVVWPAYLRREVASLKFHKMVYRTPEDKQEIPYDDYWEFIDWKSNSYNFYKNKIMLEAVCNKFNVPFYDLEIDDEFHLHQDDMAETYGLAQKSSFGLSTHTAIANYFQKKITHELSLFERSRSL
jgi:hypothetical protein